MSLIGAYPNAFDKLFDEPVLRGAEGLLANSLPGWAPSFASKEAICATD
ncbi:protein of unknown function [Methylocaldum szegediense]|uniref:Uncharacterized protein n=1 Tax=Methylocaldum szegediense TaxID=73780 RepID=A0ABM9HWG6_9GAMM|nr:protein of unknown function [Methylocaldum szegediense]